MTVRVVSGGGGDAPRIDITMPDLIGLSVAAAYQALDSLGQTGFRELSCSSGPGSDPTDGTIASQSVAAGALMPNFKGVKFGVACGTAPPPSDEDLFLD
jgi:beta-lactam-binding protein with PASTA domain